MGTYKKMLENQCFLANNFAKIEWGVGISYLKDMVSPTLRKEFERKFKIGFVEVM